MNEPFVFRKVLYLVEATGMRARTLDQMLRVVTVVDPKTEEKRGSSTWRIG